MEGKGGKKGRLPKDELTARQDTHINNHHISMPRKALAQGGSMQVDSLPYSKE
jgi:hypothetical protein